MVWCHERSRRELSRGRNGSSTLVAAARRARARRAASQWEHRKHDATNAPGERRNSVAHADAGRQERRATPQTRQVRALRNRPVRSSAFSEPPRPILRKRLRQWLRLAPTVTRISVRPSGPRSYARGGLAADRRDALATIPCVTRGAFRCNIVRSMPDQAHIAPRVEEHPCTTLAPPRGRSTGSDESRPRARVAV